MITTENNKYGAAALFYPGIFEKIAERLGGDLVIIPSSTDEIIVLNADDAKDIDSDILEINATCVPDDKVLSNHHYKYSRVTKQITY